MSLLKYTTSVTAVQASIKIVKIFLNQCMHFEDFSIKSTWSFFATSHGKSPCDGLGGTIKHLTARASLQRTSSNQIMTARQVVKFCQDEILGITTIFIPTEAAEQRRNLMKARYSYTRTIPGTRSFHYFLPVDNNTIKAKRIAEDEEFALTFQFKKETRNERKIDVNISNYIACTYDSSAWIGVVLP